MKLSFYILREHFAPFTYSLLIITFLFVIDFFVKLLDSILTKGLDILVILEIFVLNMAWMLALSIPMGCLVGTLMALGRLSGDNEVLAMKAHGISPLRIMVPVALVATVLCLGLIAFNHYVLPEANHRAAGLRSDITRQRAPAFITPRVLIKDFNNYQLYIDSINYQTDLLYGVKIYIWERREGPRYVFSDSATLEYSEDGKFILINLMKGENHILDRDEDKGYLQIKFNYQTIAIENVDATLVRRDRLNRSDREMNVTQMLEVVERSRGRKIELGKEFPPKVFGTWHSLDSLMKGDSSREASQRFLNNQWWETENNFTANLSKLIMKEKEKVHIAKQYNQRLEGENQNISKYLVEIHKKFSIPVACIIFILVGAPLGILARKGSIGAAAIISSGFFLVYWVCLLRGEALADKLIIDPAVAMWAPNVIVGVVGLYFTYRAQTFKG